MDLKWDNYKFVRNRFNRFKNLSNEIKPKPTSIQKSKNLQICKSANIFLPIARIKLIS